LRLLERHVFWIWFFTAWREKCVKQGYGVQEVDLKGLDGKIDRVPVHLTAKTSRQIRLGVDSSQRLVAAGALEDQAAFSAFVNPVQEG
jgi:hypothetical protein